MQTSCNRLAPATNNGTCHDAVQQKCRLVVLWRLYAYLTMHFPVNEVHAARKEGLRLLLFLTSLMLLCLNLQAKDADTTV